MSLVWLQKLKCTVHLLTRGVSQNFRMLNDRFETTSGHFFANYVREYFSQN